MRMAFLMSMTPWPDLSQHAKLMLPSWNEPGQLKVFSGDVIPLWRAARATGTLNVDPGEYVAWIARFSSGWFWSPWSALHRSRVIEGTNQLGSNSGQETMPSTSPVLGSITITAPLYP